MESLESSYYEVTKKDLAKDKALKYGAWMAPVLLPILPTIIFFVIGLLSGTPATVAVFFSFAIISLIVGFVLGLIITGSLLFYRSNWLTRIRERIAVDGIKANEVDFFTHELTSAEKKSLKEIESANRLLADAYRETLASRLTATRIIKSTKQELQLVKRRENKLKYLKTENTENFQKQLKEDHAKLDEIQREAGQMRVEAESRLHMIEAAARRGSNSGTEIAMQKLSARSQQLPLALEALKMEDEIRKEIEREEAIGEK